MTLRMFKMAKRWATRTGRADDPLPSKETPPAAPRPEEKPALWFSFLRQGGHRGGSTELIQPSRRIPKPKMTAVETAAWLRQR